MELTTDNLNESSRGFSELRKETQKIFVALLLRHVFVSGPFLVHQWWRKQTTVLNNGSRLPYVYDKTKQFQWKTFSRIARR